MKRLLLFCALAVPGFGQIVNPGGGGSSGAVSSVNGQTGSVVLSVPPQPAICHDFGTSIGAGVYNTPSTANYFDTFVTAYLPSCTHDNQSVSGYSVQDSIAKEYATTFAATDLTVIEMASNDAFGTTYPMSNITNNYVDGLGAMMVYAAIPDAIQANGYAAKIKGTALSCTGTGFTATDQYAIGTKTTHVGDTCTWTFVGSAFYMGTSVSTSSSTEAFTLTFDGGTAQTFGPYGNQNGITPFRVEYAPHGGTVGYNPFLVRVPLISGRNQQHTVTVTCTTQPCYFDFMASNGAQQGPRVMMPLFWQNGFYGTQAQAAGAAAEQNVIAAYLVDQLSEDGLAVANADESGYLNYYGNSAAWANTLHPNNAGSSLLATGLGARWNQGIVAKQNQDRKIYNYTFTVMTTGYGTYFPAGTFTIPFPMKIEQVDAYISGTLPTCSGTLTPAQLYVTNTVASSAENYHFPPITSLGYNTSGALLNMRLSGFGAPQTAGYIPAACSGTPTNGSETIIVTIYYSRF